MSGLDCFPRLPSRNKGDLLLRGVEGREGKGREGKREGRGGRGGGRIDHFHGVLQRTRNELDSCGLFRQEPSPSRNCSSTPPWRPCVK